MGAVVAVARRRARVLRREAVRHHRARRPPEADVHQHPRAKILSPEACAAATTATVRLPGRMNLKEGSAYASAGRRRLRIEQPALMRVSPGDPENSYDPQDRRTRDHRPAHAAERYAPLTVGQIRVIDAGSTTAPPTTKSPPVTRTLPTAIVLAVVLTWRNHAAAQALPADASQQTATAPATTAVTSDAAGDHRVRHVRRRAGAARRSEAGRSEAGRGRRRRRDDSALNRSQPDFTLINLPTGLRLPKGKIAFRVTHRFTRPLGEGDFGDLAGDCLRHRLRRVDRPRVPVRASCPACRSACTGTSDKTIQFFGAVQLLKQQSTRSRSASPRSPQSTARTTSRTATRRRSARSSRASSASHGARLRRADLGEQHQRSAEGAGRRQRHVPLGLGARLRVRRRSTSSPRSRRASAATIRASAHAASRSRSASAATPSS